MDSTENREEFIDGAIFTQMVRGGASELRSNVDEINELNVFPVPDGDTGDNMRMTLESGLAALEKITSNDLAEVLTVLSHGMLLGARGNSGVILSQLFAGIAGGLDTNSKADVTMLGNALMLGVKQAYASVLTPKEGTILTVAREAVAYAVDRITPDSTIRTLFADLINEMQQSLIRTPELLPILKEAGVIDSGGAGLFHIMNGFNRVLNGDNAEYTASEAKAQSASENKGDSHEISLDAFGPDSVMTYGYCTEFLLRLQTSKVNLDTFDYNVITEYLQTIGDSIVAFRTDSIVKVHVHTKEPEKVLEFCHRFGEFLTLKIENMTIQHNESKEVGQEDEPPKAIVPKKKYGTVMVCSGDGIRETFLELGADYVVDGEQTQNPSTNDFLVAFNSVNAEHIFVFPNNSNIVLAAKQAASLYDGAEIHVIETTNIGEGYVALPCIEETDDIENITKRMESAIKEVAEGEITFSVRDTDIYGLHIRKGDTIGISKKKIVVFDSERRNAVRALLDTLLESNNKSVLTVFVGEEIGADEKAETEAYIAEKYPELEVYCLDGNQKVYSYIFIAE